MKKIVLILCLVTGLTLSIQSQAKEEHGLTVMPYAGYFKGTTAGDDLGDGDLTSYVAGAQLGYNMKVGFSFGIDYSQGKGRWEPDTIGAKTRDFNSRDIGVYVGYALTEKLKVTASYFPEYDVEVTEHAVEKYKGDGYNIGFSFGLMPFFRVGMTYNIRNIKEADGVELTGSGNKTDTVFATLSAPINFPYKFN